jgi:tetratricopeptide (TPR) repeat protein/tRNA A-37 threonylcarbamoyl transferase component Bud32
MGVVWEAEQERPKRRVALKVIRRDHLVDELHRRMFHREAETLARLKHPNIAAIYASGHTDGGHDYFAMEMVRGQTLDRWLAERPARLDDKELELRLRLFGTICEAVHYAHQRGVIHRDLKPANLVIADDAESASSSPSGVGLPVVKILDFGLARITDADVAATQVSEIGMIKGTLQYMSPEQARGDVEAIDVRSDVYALGMILYELLTGRRPYEVTPTALAEAVRVICEDRHIPLRQSWSGVRKPDGDLDTIVGKALEKEADRRYGSAAALAEDIGRYLDSQPIQARPPSAAYQLRKMVQRNRLAAGFAAAVLLLVVAFGVTATVQARAIALQRDRAEAEAAKARAVNEFMRETLSAANPWKSSSDVTVAEALDQATTRISTSFADQAEVEAEVRQTVGNAYSELGRYDAARPLLEEAVDARTQLLGRDHPDTIESMAALAQLGWRESRFEEAVRLSQELLELRRQVYGEASSEVAVTLDFLGRLQTDAGHYDEADTSLREALAMALSLHGERSVEVAAVYQNQAVLAQVWRQDYALAEELTRKEIDIKRELQGTESLDFASALNNLGIFVLLQGRLEEAAEILEESLATDRRVAGDTHPEVARVLENLGNVYYRMGRYDRTLEMLGEVIAIRRQVLGEDSPEVARSLANRGTVYRVSGNLEQAEASLREAATRMERAYGPDHADVASARRSLAFVLRDRGKLAEAESQLRAALAVAERAYPAESPGLAGYRGGLGTVLVMRGRYREAEPLLLEAYQVQLEAGGAEDQRTIQAADALVELYDAWGRPAEADRYRLE